MNKSKNIRHPLRKYLKIWHILLYLVLLMLGITTNIFEYQSRYQDILNLFQQQAAMTSTVMVNSGNQQIYLSHELKTSYIDRAFDFLYTIDLFEQQEIFRQFQMQELAAQQNIFRVTIYNPDRDIISQIGQPHGSSGRGERGILRRLEPLFEGVQDSIILKTFGFRRGNNQTVDENSERFVVAIRRTLGGVISCHLSVEAEQKLFASTDLEKLLDRMTNIDGVAYLKLQLLDTESIFKSKTNISESDISESEKKELQQSLYWINTENDSYIESKEDINFKFGTGILRIGFETEKLSNLKKHIFYNILIRSSFLSIIAVIFIFFIISKQNTSLIHAEKDRIEKEVRRLEQIHRLQEKQVALGNLAAGVAHEIRNPLNAIGIIAQRLKREYQPENNYQEYNDLTDSMSSEINRISWLLNEFLDYAKPSKLKLDMIEVNALIDKIVRLYTHEASEKNITIETKLSQQLLINGDHQYLEQALVNLIKNAVDASPEQGLIQLTTEQIAEDVEIRIKDNGIGIEKKDLNRIFDLFYTTKAAGSGIGLAMVHKIINDHGGSIEVESVPEKGTTFILTIPQGKI